MGKVKVVLNRGKVYGVKGVAVFRLLLVCPLVPGIDAVPEVRYLTSLDNIRVTVLGGHVTSNDIYTTCRNQKYDAIHVASHSNDEFVPINGDKLYGEDLVQVARLCRASLVFLNSCVSGRLSSYISRHAIDYSICNNAQLEDHEAWKTPMLFYGFINNQIAATGSYSVPDAFDEAAPDDGEYGIYVAHHRSRVVEVSYRIDQVEQHMMYLLVVDGITLGLILILFIALKLGWLP